MIVIVQIIFNPPYLNGIKTTLTNIGTGAMNSAKSIANPTPQNQALANCTSQVNNLANRISNYYSSGTQVTTLNTTTFLAENASATITNWINYWAIPAQNYQAPTYNDEELILNSTKNVSANQTIAIGIVLKASFPAPYGGEAIWPVLCNASGNLMPHDARIK